MVGSGWPESMTGLCPCDEETLGMEGLLTVLGRYDTATTHVKMVERE
jgi:hypothetical protein